MRMASRNSPVKSSNTQSNAPSGHVPSILQLSLWDLLAEATRVPLDAQLWMLFDDLDEAIANLSIDQQIFVAGEGLARVGEIVGLRAEIHLQEINYLLHPDQEPVRAEVVAAIHDDEPESPFALAHDEDIGGWSARIGDCLVVCGGSMGFWSIVEVTELAPVEVLLGLLLGSGTLMKRSGGEDDEGFYRRDGFLVLGIDRP
jgi:hypothetical protein